MYASKISHKKYLYIGNIYSGKYFQGTVLLSVYPFMVLDSWYAIIYAHTKESEPICMCYIERI